MIERFRRSLKYEIVILHAYENVVALYFGIASYIRFYNLKRKHQGFPTRFSIGTRQRF